MALLVVGCAGWIGRPVPGAVADRQVLPTCGTEQLEQVTQPATSSRQCLLDAYLDGATAELISTRPTVEGDPITTFYRVLPADAALRVELFTDSTRDRFGSGRWSHTACRELISTGDAWVFEPVGCGEPTPL